MDKFMAKAIPSMSFYAADVETLKFDPAQTLSVGGMISMAKSKPEYKHWIFSPTMKQDSLSVPFKTYVILCMWKAK